MLKGSSPDSYDPQNTAIDTEQVLKKDPPEAYYTMSSFPLDETQFVLGVQTKPNHHLLKRNAVW